MIVSGGNVASHLFCAAQIDTCEIEFNAKISSVTSSSRERSSSASVGVSVRGGWGPVSVGISASYSSQSQSKNYNEEKREYSMRILVKARQAPIPAGLSRILDILEAAIMNRLEVEAGTTE
jgi:hypothetical protein